MNRLQKIALFNLGVAMTGLGLQLIQFLISEFLITRLIASSVTFILCSFLVASCIFRGKIAKQGGPHYDERDSYIHKRAALAGFITFFLVLFLEVMISLSVVGFDSSITIGWIFTIFILAALSIFFVESVTILIQYGRIDKGEKP